MIITIRDQSGRHLLLDAGAFSGTGIWSPRSSGDGSVNPTGGVIQPTTTGAYELGQFVSVQEAWDALGKVHDAVASNTSYCDPCGGNIESPLVLWRQYDGSEYEWNAETRILHERKGSDNRTIGPIDTSKEVSTPQLNDSGGWLGEWSVQWYGDDGLGGKYWLGPWREEATAFRERLVAAIAIGVGTYSREGNGA